MTTNEKTRRMVVATIQAIAMKQGTKGPYATVSTNPRQGMKHPDNYNAWDVETVKGFQAGDVVTLTLEQGRSRVDNPQKEYDWYWDLVQMAPATGQPQAAPAGTQGQDRPIPAQLIKPYQDPRDQSIQRQVALKAAVEWAGYHMGIGHEKTFTTKDVLAVATAFADWLEAKASKGEAQ